MAILVIIAVIAIVREFVVIAIVQRTEENCNVSKVKAYSVFVFPQQPSYTL